MEDLSLLKGILRKACAENKCSYGLLAGIVAVESEWNPWVARYEAGYPYLVSPVKFSRLNHISQETEETLQRLSWGLGQVMGGSARDIGYTGPLTMLCMPELNAEIMCRFFVAHCTKYKLEDEQIAAYNAGTPKRGPDGKFVNQAYVDSVKKALIELRGKFVQ